MTSNFNLDKLPRTLSLEMRDHRAVLNLIDQRELPYKLSMIEARTSEEVIDAVKKLAVRGAPALGVAGAAALCLWVYECCDLGLSSNRCEADLDAAASRIASARPTAVNLSWGVSRALDCAKGALTAKRDVAACASALYTLVKQMEEEDERCNRAIGKHGAALFDSEKNVLTHCNAGSLATVFFGTALGVVYAAAEQGKIKRVYADETRPVGQGSRLTSWELAQAGVNVTLLCDNMAASLMRSGAIDMVIVGADRIAANGDTANKIGTYGVAVLAHEHNIPFYVAAPISTIDASIETGDGIPIEFRAWDEVLPQRIAGVDVYNPAFDVTPARYITGIITEVGVFKPSEIARALKG